MFWKGKYLNMKLIVFTSKHVKIMGICMVLHRLDVHVFSPIYNFLGSGSEFFVCLVGFKTFLIYFCKWVYVCICVYTHACRYLERREVLDPLELQLCVIVSHLAWILGTEHGSSGRAAGLPNL